MATFACLGKGKVRRSGGSGGEPRVFWRVVGATNRSGWRFQVNMVRIILLALVALFVTAGTLSYLLGVVLR